MNKIHRKKKLFNSHTNERILLQKKNFCINNLFIHKKSKSNCVTKKEKKNIRKKFLSTYILCCFVASFSYPHIILYPPPTTKANYYNKYKFFPLHIFLSFSLHPIFLKHFF